MANTTRARWADLIERTALTYAATVAGLLAADTTGSLSIGAVKVAAVSAAPAAFTAIKSAFALAFGSSGTASLLPAPKPNESMAPFMAEPVDSPAQEAAPAPSPAGPAASPAGPVSA